MDLLLFVLIFLGIVFFNYVMQRAARRRREEEQAQAGQPAPPPAEEEPLEELWGRAPAAAPAPAPSAMLAARQAAAAPPAPLRRHPVRALLKDKRDLRRAVVLTMVLGPCRAQEPPER
ncbi:MAG: hypothetical protein A3G81_29735 [Betaproteobacteria bacterium RIFCSPLOWO2_12_FULL_65_14]|nr:MAG: hypothetical protein A3G81_29735 [Betaproteobacteria bacterium RIFCSPLOWO2_12_FULL_65_14]